jgi:hypothetical protein
MSSLSEARIYGLEIKVNQLLSQMLNLQRTVAGLSQQINALASGGGGRSGGGGSSSLIAFGSAGGISAANGPPPNGVLGQGAADWNIFSVSGLNNNYVPMAQNVVVVNPMPNSIAQGVVLEVFSNGDGTYTASAVACQAF